MKEFNLVKAKAGKPICTRDGRKARIICWDRKTFDYPIIDYPIIALIEEKDTNDKVHETSENYTIDGKYYIDDKESRHDLMMATEKHEGWINIYKSHSRWVDDIYDTKEEAEEIGKMPPSCIATVKIEWEE